MSWPLIMLLAAVALVIAGAIGNGARGAAQVAIALFLIYWAVDILRMVNERLSKKDRDRG